MNEEERDMLVALIMALVARSGDVVILSMAEVEKVWTSCTFQYNLSESDVIIELQR